MSNLTGAVSGTKVIVAIGTGLGGASGAPYTALQGETSHTLTDTVEAIEITNKSDADVRCFLESEGRRLLDLTIEAFDNSGAQFDALYAAYDAKQSISVQRVLGGRTITSNYMVTSVSDNPSLNTGISTSFTLASTGAIVVS